MKKKYIIRGLAKICDFLCEYYPDFFCKWEENGTREDLVLRDFVNSALTGQSTKKVIYFFQINNKQNPRRNIRTSDVVDQHFLKENDENLPVFCRTMDISAPNFVITPLCHNFPERISMEEDYFKIVNRQPNDRLFNKCFWRGSPTHYTRKNVVDFLNSKKNKLIDVDFWQAKTGSIYGDQPSPKAWEYINFFEEMKKSDIGLCIRGDRAWLYSFFDIMRAGAIPVCINTQYHNLGLENIGYKVDDLFLSYDLTKGDTLEDVYDGITRLLQNKEKCLEMKKNVTRFYKSIYLTDRTLNVKKIDYFPGLTGFGDFFAAKVIDIIENDFKLKDNKLFTETVFDIKRNFYSSI